MRKPLFIAFAVLAAAAALSPVQAASNGFHPLYAFGGPQSMEEPLGLTAGPDGVFYSLVNFDQSTGGGAVIQLQRPTAAGQKWAETVIYTLSVSAWGTSLAVGPDGTVYVSTVGDGAYGNGTVLALQPPSVAGGVWTESILYNFPGPPFGNGSGVSLAATGILYGVAASGGSLGQGMVFALAPPASSGALWTELDLYDFTGGADGSSPTGITINAKGVIYGMTYSGGLYGEGTVFELRPSAYPERPWVETVLYNFPGGQAGEGAGAALLIGPDGTLYGGTSSTVFSLSPPTSPGEAWTETVLGTIGPDSTLAMHQGAIYATYSSLFCICTCSGGLAFKLEKPSSGNGPWTTTYLHAFKGNAMPLGPIAVDPDGTLFGTTLGSGVGYSSGSGILYKIDPSSTETESVSDPNSNSDVCGSGVLSLPPRRWQR